MRLLCVDIDFCFYLFVLILCAYVKAQASRSPTFTAHYCVPPHCTDFTDMDLTASVFLVLRALSLFYYIIIIVVVFVLCIRYH